MPDKKKQRMVGGRPLSPESLMMSYGYRPELSEGSLKCPIFQTSTFVFRTAEEGKAFFEVAYGIREQGPDERLGLIYSRLNNPDLEILEDRLTLWDEAEACAVFESGMASIATTIFTFLRPGSVLLYSQPVYGGTEHLFNKVLPEFGIETVGFIAAHGRKGIEAALDEGEDRRERLSMIYVETPANPTNDLVSIKACVDIAGRCSEGREEADRVRVAVDNTFLGPLWQHPLKVGADLVLYSLTKYVGGHSDVIAGACLGNREVIGRVKASRTFFGSMASPWTGWLLLRSLETLKVRMTEQAENARFIADWLRDHPKVARVHYLGHLTEKDDDFATWNEQCLGAGAMISFSLRGGEAEAFRMLNALELVKLAVSLGSTESLAEHPGSMTHADVSAEEKKEMGITPGMVRLSVGVENREDLVADLGQALEAV